MVLGAVIFVVFFWLVPAWLTTWVEARQSGTFRPVVEAILGRRIHWFKWLAVAIALLFVYFAARDYLGLQRHTRSAERDAGLLARLIARLLS